jgi:hypothetical protein
MKLYFALELKLLNAFTVSHRTSAVNTNIFTVAEVKCGQNKNFSPLFSLIAIAFGIV